MELEQREGEEEQLQLEDMALGQGEEDTRYKKWTERRLTATLGIQLLLFSSSYHFLFRAYLHPSPQEETGFSDSYLQV